MKQTFQILVVLTLLPLSGFATGQAGDILILKTDTLALFSNPLEQYLDNKTKRTISGQELIGTSTACHRGYRATWKLENDSLFLIRVQKGCYRENTKYYDLKLEFGSNRVFAKWFTGNTLSPRGKQIHHTYSGYESFYENELALTFKEGLLKKQIEYDNSKSYKSAFTENSDKLQKFIYTNINWRKIPNLKESKKVFISILSGKTTTPDSVKIARSSGNKLLDEEAIKVIKLLPDWNVYYRQGKVYRRKWIIPIVFSEEKRKKYAR